MGGIGRIGAVAGGAGKGPAGAEVIAVVGREGRGSCGIPGRGRGGAGGIVMAIVTGECSAAPQSRLLGAGRLVVATGGQTGAGDIVAGGRRIGDPDKVDRAGAVAAGVDIVTGAAVIAMTGITGGFITQAGAVGIVGAGGADRRFTARMAGATGGVDGVARYRSDGPAGVEEVMDAIDAGRGMTGGADTGGCIVGGGVGVDLDGAVTVLAGSAPIVAAEGEGVVVAGRFETVAILALVGGAGTVHGAGCGAGAVNDAAVPGLVPVAVTTGAGEGSTGIEVGGIGPLVCPIGAVGGVAGGETGAGVGRGLGVVLQTEVGHGISGQGAVDMAGQATHRVVTGGAAASDTLVMFLTGNGRGDGVETGGRQIGATTDVGPGGMAIGTGDRRRATGPVSRLR